MSECMCVTWNGTAHGSYCQLSAICRATKELFITMGCKEILASDLVRCVAAVLIVSRRRLLGRHSKLHETVVVIKFRLMLAALKSGTWCLAQV